MVRKLLFIFSLVAVLAMSLASTANAEILSGRGWLKAHGSGVAKLAMSGDVTIHVQEHSVIRIRGAEIVKADGRGQRINQPNGVVVLRGHRGVVKIIGHDMTIHIIGHKVEFLAQGQGTAHLKGRGHYQTRNNSGQWSSVGSDLPIEAQ